MVKTLDFWYTYVHARRTHTDADKILDKIPQQRKLPKIGVFLNLFSGNEGLDGAELWKFRCIIRHTNFGLHRTTSGFLLQKSLINCISMGEM